MSALPYILIIIILLSLIFSYLSMINKKNSFDIVRDMGIGYNLGNTFDNYDYNIDKMDTPEQQITLRGNTLPTKKMIKKLKKFGFKTIRFPVTWLYFIDDYGNINSEWILLVKEVVDLIIEAKLYCILNLYDDGYYGNWLSYGIEVKDKYVNLWTQIANEFKDYNNYLIFESMNDVYFYSPTTYDYDYDTIFNLNQAFVDTIRNSGGNNIERLLLVAGANDELDITCSPEYKFPVDPSNKLALSLHYYDPSSFTSGYYYEPFNWTDGNEVYYYGPTLSWGDQGDYFRVITNFEIMKNNFIKKGIPVIISEVGVFTEERKELESIREYLYTIFSMSSDSDGIMCCLWDTSNKEHGDMNYYDRENDKWYDEKLKEYLIQISKGKYIKPMDFYIKINSETIINPFLRKNLQLKIGSRKALKIILNVRLTGTLFIDLEFTITSYDVFRKSFTIKYEKSNGKKQYDGTYIFTIDVSKIECYEYIIVSKSYGNQFITLNNLTVEFEDNFQSIDYKSYKAAISNYIQ